MMLLLLLGAKRPRLISIRKALTLAKKSGGW
jgi:hypothetical protein